MGALHETGWASVFSAWFSGIALAMQRLIGLKKGAAENLVGF